MNHEDFHLGGYEIKAADLKKKVPAGWPNSLAKAGSKTRKSFKDYGLWFESKNKDKVLLVIGWRDHNKNRPKRVGAEEFQLWVDYFKKQPLTKQELEALRKTEENV